jgi:hypothetical protein
MKCFKAVLVYDPMFLVVDYILYRLRRPIAHDYVVHVYDVTSVELTRDATLTSLLPALKHFMLKSKVIKVKVTL